MKNDYEGFDLSEKQRQEIEKRKNFRRSEMELPHKVYITEKVYLVLRKQKRVQKKSMARIVCEMVLSRYAK